MITEWAPLWTVPVVPLPDRVVPAHYVPDIFPGALDSRALVVLRRIRAAILVPRIPVDRETRLPIPAVALNRRGHNAESRIVHVPTARGFDMYRLDRGRLQEIWSRQEPDSTSEPLGWSGPVRRLCAPFLTRSSWLSDSVPYLGTVGILAVALGLQLLVEDLPRTVPESSTGEQAKSAPAPYTTVPLGAITTVLIELSRSMTGFRLLRLELDGNGGVIRFRVDLPVSKTLQELAVYLPEAWDRAARWSEAGTEVTVTARVSPEVFTEVFTEVSHE